MRISTPYITENDRRTSDEKENRKRWIAKSDFLKFVGKATVSRPRYISNYVNLTPSESPLNYNFRRIYKEKWIAPTNFAA